MKRQTVKIVIMSALLAAGLIVTTQATSNLLARPTAVGVVNIEEVVAALTEKQQLDAEMKTKRDSLAAEQATRQKQIEKLEFDLNALRVGTPAYEAKQAQLQKAVLELQVWIRFEQQKAGRELGLQTQRLYEKILTACGNVGRDNGYDLVLFRESTVEPNFENPQQLQAMIQLRKVLYANPQIDLTDQVIQRMNNEYENAN